jgi:hypothetical protein
MRYEPGKKLNLIWHQIITRKAIFVSFFGKSEPKLMPCKVIDRWDYLKAEQHSFFEAIEIEHEADIIKRIINLNK